MTSTKLEYDTLGNIHKQYNKKTRDAIANNKTLDEKVFTEDKQDLNNLMKIDIASQNKDIYYILSVLKCEDMLYVSRALKQSKWLVDDEYANVVNPEYLQENVYPYMITKARIKLQKHIRHHLKTEARVEQFYKNESTLIAAAKWLSRCSVSFIEENIEKHMNHITDLEFKRLCEKSVAIFQSGMKDNLNDKHKFRAASFLLHTHLDEYLDVIDKMYRYARPTFGPATTELILKQTPQRVKSNIIKYVDCIHIPTFVKYIKREDVKKFLFDLVNKEDKEEDKYYYRSLFKFSVIEIFIRRMPEDEQFEFVKKVFIDKDKTLEIDDDLLVRGTEIFAMKQIKQLVRPSIPIYEWYVFAPFITAFEEIKNLIQTKTSADDKYSMLNMLIKCTQSNYINLLLLLNYYLKTSLNDTVEQKKQFINNILLQGNVYNMNNKTWKEFMDIINTLGIYTHNDYNQEFINNVILHHILKDIKVPENIEQCFTFCTLKQFRIKLNQNDQTKLFEYLYNILVLKLNKHNIENEKEFEEATIKLRNVLDLLLDWDKELAHYPFILNKVKYLVKLRKTHSWKCDLSDIYNRKKSWRRLMFEESIMMNPTQDTCMNALKHDPELLSRYNNEVDAMCCDDATSLIQMLRKLRIYWPESLAKSWMKSYTDRLNEPGGHTAVVRGIITLLPQESLLNMIHKYAPVESKIDWNNTNEIILGLQRSFAKNMHIARPLPPADAILLYAKGDFLQYALPSLLAIYYNMGRVQSEKHIPKLLDAPVSLQKHGLRFAFMKLKHEELKYHLTNVWKTSKNMSIRAVSFVLLYDLMCKEKDANKIDELWELLEIFIDNLSFKEDKKIYEKLSDIDKIPNKIKPKFLIRSYNFLKNLLPHLKNERENYEYNIRHLVAYTRDVMEDISPEFVAGIITEYYDNNFFNNKVEYMGDDMVRVFTSYLLCAKDEETQSQKYEKLLAPLIKQTLDKWNETNNGKFYVRNHFQQVLTRFAYDLNEYVIIKNMVIPTKMFTTIQHHLKTLSVPQNYVMLSMWKLTVKRAEIIMKIDKREDTLQISQDLVPEYGKYCLDVLKEDVKSYFSCIYVLYAKVLNMAINNFLPEAVYLDMCEVMLSDIDFIPAFLVILRMLAETRYYYEDPENEKGNKIKKLIYDHPSVEVKMHYHSTFTNDN